MSPAAALPLRDIHLPGEPSWWPPAPGWWVLAALLALAVWWLGRRLLQALRRRRQRAELGAEMRRIQRAHESDPVAQLAAASELLRRACRRYAPAALALQGEDWLAFLDGRRSDVPFTRGAGRLLLDGPYRRRLDGAEVQAVLGLIERRLLALPGEQAP